VGNLVRGADCSTVLRKIVLLRKRVQLKGADGKEKTLSRKGGEGKFLKEKGGGGEEEKWGGHV